jgi:hypothetical protein
VGWDDACLLPSEGSGYGSPKARTNTRPQSRTRPPDFTDSLSGNPQASRRRLSVIGCQRWFATRCRRTLPRKRERAKTRKNQRGKCRDGRHGPQALFSIFRSLRVFAIRRRHCTNAGLSQMLPYRPLARQALGRLPQPPRKQPRSIPLANSRVFSDVPADSRQPIADSLPNLSVPLYTNGRFVL